MMKDVTIKLPKYPGNLTSTMIYFFLKLTETR